MVDNNTLHKYALDKANKSLEHGFDVEAYIVKYIAEKCVDKVPESNIDEQIDNINEYFINYMNTRSSQDLTIMLLHIRQMVSEMYHLCDNNEQKQIFRNEIHLFTNIIA